MVHLFLTSKLLHRVDTIWPLYIFLLYGLNLEFRKISNHCLVSMLNYFICSVIISSTACALAFCNSYIQYFQLVPLWKKVLSLSLTVCSCNTLPYDQLYYSGNKWVSSWVVVFELSLILY